MPRTPTGRPPGRPKTNWYETLSARIPQDLADQIRKYAARHRQSLSDVFRDGFTILLQEDRYAPMVSDTNGAQGIMSDIIPTPEIMSDMNGTQESISDTIHQQRLREIVYDMNEDVPEQEIVSDMNGTAEIVSDMNSTEDSISDMNGAPGTPPKRKGRKRKPCDHPADQWKKDRSVCLECQRMQAKEARKTQKQLTKSFTAVKVSRE